MVVLEALDLVPRVVAPPSYPMRLSRRCVGTVDTRRSYTSNFPLLLINIRDRCTLFYLLFLFEERGRKGDCDTSLLSLLFRGQISHYVPEVRAASARAELDTVVNVSLTRDCPHSVT